MLGLADSLLADTLLADLFLYSYENEILDELINPISTGLFYLIVALGGGGGGGGQGFHPFPKI